MKLQRPLTARRTLALLAGVLLILTSLYLFLTPNKVADTIWTMIFMAGALALLGIALLYYGYTGRELKR